MKLAVFNRHFARRAGGAESYSVSLVEGLAEQRLTDGAFEFDIHVFAQTIDHSHPRVTYHKVPGPLRRPRWINQLVFATYTWWKTKAGFDVIHSHENTWHGQVQTVHVRPIRYNLFHPNHQALTGWRLCLRWLKVCTSPRLGFYVWLEAARMRQPVVVTVSDEMHRQTLAAYPYLGAQSVPIILPGVGTPDVSLTKEAARTKLGLSLHQKTLLFVGNDYARKGLPALLAAMPALEGNIHLLCVGAASQKPKFQLMAAELGIADRVHFVGALADVSLAYRAADMLVHPTLEDSFAMVVLEAMSYGLPVVVSSAQYCGISAFLQDEVDALILKNPRDSVALTLAIHRLIKDPGLGVLLRESGLHFASRHHYAKVIDKYRLLFNKIINLNENKNSYTSS